jgi:hypothetical protein
MNRQCVPRVKSARDPCARCRRRGLRCEYLTVAEQVKQRVRSPSTSGSGIPEAVAAPNTSLDGEGLGGWDSFYPPGLIGGHLPPVHVAEFGGNAPSSSYTPISACPPRTSTKRHPMPRPSPIVGFFNHSHPDVGFEPYSGLFANLGISPTICHGNTGPHAPTLKPCGGQAVPQAAYVPAFQKSQSLILSPAFRCGFCPLGECYCDLRSQYISKLGRRRTSSWADMTTTNGSYRCPDDVHSYFGF